MKYSLQELLAPHECLLYFGIHPMKDLRSGGGEGQFDGVIGSGAFAAECSWPDGVLVSPPCSWTTWRWWRSTPFGHFFWTRSTACSSSAPTCSPARLKNEPTSELQIHVQAGRKCKCVCIYFWSFALGLLWLFNLKNCVSFVMSWPVRQLSFYKEKNPVFWKNLTRS